MDKRLNRISLLWGIPGLLVTGAGAYLLNTGGSEALGNLLVIVGDILVLIALVYYARAKGYHWAWGLLGLLSLAGFIIMGIMPDRHRSQETVARKLGRQALRFLGITLSTVAVTVIALIVYVRHDVHHTQWVRRQATAPVVATVTDISVWPKTYGPGGHPAKIVAMMSFVWRGHTYHDRYTGDPERSPSLKAGEKARLCIDPSKPNIYRFEFMGEHCGLHVGGSNSPTPNTHPIPAVHVAPSKATQPL